MGNKGISLYMSVYHTTYTFHLHTPSSYLISRFSPVVTVNVLHHISHHITVITLHVWVTMRYHCICLCTIQLTHYTFTLPPLISSPDSDLWPRSTYYITYHTTPLLSLHVWVTMGYHCICLYTHSTFTLPPLISSPGSHLWPRWSNRAWTRRQRTPHDASAEDDTWGRTAGNWHDIYWCNTDTGRVEM